MIASALGLGIAGWLEEGRELAAEADAAEDAGDFERSVGLRMWAMDVFNEGASVANRQAAVVAFFAGLLLALAIVTWLL